MSSEKLGSQLRSYMERTDLTPEDEALLEETVQQLEKPQFSLKDAMRVAELIAHFFRLLD